MDGGWRELVGRFGVSQRKVWREQPLLAIMLNVRIPFCSMKNFMIMQYLVCKNNIISTTSARE